MSALHLDLPSEDTARQAETAVRSLRAVTQQHPGGVVRLEPDGFVPRHLHLRQDEQLEVLTGSIQLRTGGTSRLLGAGDTATVARRRVHRVANAGASEASFVLEVHPARRIERTIRLTFAAGRALRPLVRRGQDKAGSPASRAISP